MVETTATPVQPTEMELLQVKDATDQAVSKQTGKQFQSTMRDFRRNFDRKMEAIKGKMGQAISFTQAKLEALNTWYLGNFLYTIYGGAFLGSLITCSSILTQYLLTATAITSVLPVAGAAVFAIPIIVFATYWGIKWLIMTAKGLVQLAKDGTEFIKTLIAYKKNNPKANIFRQAEEGLKEQIPTEPATNAGY